MTKKWQSMDSLLEAASEEFLPTCTRCKKREVEMLHHRICAHCQFLEEDENE